MGSSIPQIVLSALGGCFLGVAIGWFVQATIGKRRFGKLASRTLQQLDEATAERDKLASESSRSRSTIESLQAASARRSAELEAVLDKSKLLARNVLILRRERERTKRKVSKIQTALVSVRNKSAALQAEFDKSRDFYKRELAKSFEKRKVLEEDVKKARSEQEAFAKLVETSILEHGSPENMLAAAQLRLGQLDVLERTVNKLEAENAQLRRDAVRMKQELDAQERDLATLVELKVHNKQLVRCVEALESSRQEHEADAERYRQQADQSEKESDTLRLKLDDLEKNFADIEKQQHRAIEDARTAAVVPILRKQR